MALSNDEIRECAERLDRAERTRTQIRQISLEHPGITIEDAYAQLLGGARNQYTLGYQTHQAASGAYRSIEVLVNRPGCKSSLRPCVNVYARDGFYPAPPQRQ
jgi:hypothetical protein